MSRLQRYRQQLYILLVVGLVLIAGYSYFILKNSIPDYIRIEEGGRFPFLAKGLDVTVVEATSTEISDIPKNEIKMKVTNETAFGNHETGSYIAEYKLFGFLGIKNVEMDVVEKQSVFPCGFPVGIYVETEGVMVIGTGQVNSLNGEMVSPAENILKSGDYIIDLNGEPLRTKQQFIKKLNEQGSSDVILGVRRNNEEMQVKITPIQTGEGEYKLGVWIRDNTQGVGMLTYVDKKGRFGALGHGINDVDTSLLMEIENGKILKTDILSIVKGKKGSPGELVGVIDYKEINVMGSIEKNASSGIFGKVDENLSNQLKLQPYQVAMKQDVKVGNATILSAIDGEIKEYQIQILEVNYSEKNQNKGLVIHVTDEALLEKTGGIVQGMSGSPIIQNGKIIGAVTHVFVQESTKGFGIFIENMLLQHE